MSRRKLILYSPALACCTCYEQIFNEDFDTFATDIAEEFVKRIHQEEPDAAVVCFCSTREADAGELLQLDALAGPLPVLTCSKALTLEFVSAAAQQGANRFLRCEWKQERIEATILEAIQRGGVKEFLEAGYPGSLGSSPHVRKMVDEIVHAFPHRMNQDQIAERLGISLRWLQKLCREAFGITYSHLMRCIWLHQALRMMKYTSLDNIEIAMQLGYSEESSLARDFHKELGYSPTEARRRLTHHTPQQLLQ